MPTGRYRVVTEFEYVLLVFIGRVSVTVTGFVGGQLEFFFPCFCLWVAHGVDCVNRTDRLDSN